ncbi:MAG: YceI family protein, partial [Bacteroidota bacterium]
MKEVLTIKQPKMKKILFLLVLTFFAGNIFAQEIHLTRNGKISFFSHTAVEDIKAENNQVFSSINTKTGALQFLVLIKGFQFKNASMQQHFNDVEYMNSSVYPKSEFKGTIKDLSKVNFSKDGVYPVQVEGNLTLHGVTNSIQTEGIIRIQKGKIESESKFKISLADYKIKIPSIVTAKIAESVDVTIRCAYEPYKTNP